MDKEKMININASLVEEPVFSSFEKYGEEVKVANFTLAKNYGGGKEYTKCSVYGEKSEMARDFKKGKLSSINIRFSLINLYVITYKVYADRSMNYGTSL